MLEKDTIALLPVSDASYNVPKKERDQLVITIHQRGCKDHLMASVIKMSTQHENN